MSKRGRKKNQAVKKWTDYDISLLKSLYLVLTDEQLSELLGRSPKTIHSVRRKYGLMKHNKVGKIMSQEIATKVPVIIVEGKNKYNQDNPTMDDFTKDFYE